MNAGRARGLLAAACVCALALSGCDDDGGARPVALDVAGSWRQVAGSYLFIPGYDITEASLTFFLELAAAAEGATYIRPFSSGIVYCGPALYGFTADGLLVLATDRGESGLYRAARPDANTLVLTNVDGQESIFTETALPDSMRCLALDIVARHDLPVDLEYLTGLAYDGISLWFTGRGQESLIAVDPDNGEIGAPRDLVAKEAPLVHGAAGADLWRTASTPYGVAGSASRVGPDETILDTVGTVELGFPLEVRCLAADPDAGTLIVHGGSTFLEVDAAAEPDRLLAAVQSHLSVDAMTWMGKRLLAVAGGPVPCLLELDPATFRATRTYEEFDPGLDVGGIAAAGDRLFLLARPPRSTQAVLLEVEP